jgi:hypothetical protein
MNLQLIAALGAAVIASFFLGFWQHSSNAAGFSFFGLLAVALIAIAAADIVRGRNRGPFE